MSEDPYPYKEIGRRLKALRGDLSQGAFARRVGVVQQQYGRYEKGRIRPPTDILERVAAQTGASIDWILSGETETPIKVVRVAEEGPAYLRVSEEPGELLPGNAWGGVEWHLSQSKALVVQALQGLKVSVDDYRRALIAEYVFIHRLDFAQVVDLLRLLGLTGAIGVGAKKPSEKP